MYSNHISKNIIITKASLTTIFIIHNNKNIIIYLYYSSPINKDFISPLIIHNLNLFSKIIFNNILYLSYHNYSLGNPTYLVPLVIIPPKPSDPYFVLSRILIKSILLFLSEKDNEVATIAGSKA